MTDDHTADHTDDDIEYLYLDEDGNPIDNPTTAEIEAAVLVDHDHPVVARHRGRPAKPSREERRAMSRGQRALLLFRRHRILSGIAIVLTPLLLYMGVTFVRAMTKPGQESADARVVQWARDNGLGFLVDRVEQKYYDSSEPPSGGQPDQNAVAFGGEGPIKAGDPTGSSEPGTTDKGGRASTTATTASQIPHTPLPQKVPTPAAQPIPNEGEWFGIGPDLGGGLHAMYTTKVRPNAEKTSLLVFVAWIDPKLANIVQYPGAELPGGQWSLPNYVTPDRCPKLLFAGNGGFRFEIPNTGYYAEGREAVKLKDGAASLVIKKDGSVDIVQWGKQLGRNDLESIASVRQNLQMLVDDGKPVNMDADWGALLKNTYFVWRSAWGVNKDGALIYVGGPALTPKNLADTLVNAGAVRALEFDINPEWVTGNLYSVGADGKCKGTRGLDTTEDKGGMRKPGDRYLSLDTRDFIAVFSK